MKHPECSLPRCVDGKVPVYEGEALAPCGICSRLRLRDRLVAAMVAPEPPKLEVDVDPEADLALVGVHAGMTNAAYHGGRGFSKSNLDLVAKSPEHFAEEKVRPRKSTRALELGTVFHTAVLEPHLLPEVVVPGLEKPGEPGTKLERRSKVDKATWAAYEEEHAGKVIATREELEQIAGMVAAVRRHPAARILLDPDAPGGVELSAYWVDPRTGLLCRCRPDRWHEALGFHVDLKSTLEADVSTASWSSFERTANAHRYHVSDAMTSAGWKHATGEEARGYLFVAVEKEPPFSVGIYRYGLEARERGHELMCRDLETLANCIETGLWPGYPPEVRALDLPPWAYD